MYLSIALGRSIEIPAPGSMEIGDGAGRDSLPLGLSRGSAYKTGIRRFARLPDERPHDQRDP